jgi:hypothetical protein
VIRIALVEEDGKGSQNRKGTQTRGKAGSVPTPERKKK